MGRPFYSRIAKQWNEATGNAGGPFKKYVLNSVLLEEIRWIENHRILEIGAGNGYFMPMVLRRYSGQKAARIAITDHSGALLEIARKNHRIDYAEYMVLDVGRIFPFEKSSFDLLLATMLFNELPSKKLLIALHECYRVLDSMGKLLATVTHPEFITRLEKNGKLSRLGTDFYTMPGAGSLHIPVVPRIQTEYKSIFDRVGFGYTVRDLYPSDEVINERPGLRHARDVPLGMLFICERKGTEHYLTSF